MHIFYFQMAEQELARLLTLNTENLNSNYFVDPQRGGVKRKSESTTSTGFGK